MELFEKAIAGAEKNGFLQEAALAFELAGRFYMDRGLGHIGRMYLREARYRYLKWGAAAKVARMESAWGSMLDPVGQPDDAGDVLAGTRPEITSLSGPEESGVSNLLDLSSILAASQTISISLEDIDLEESSQGTSQLPPGPYVKLSVMDTGMGISPDIIKRIFDPYFTTKSVDKGTGMGLAVVHGIVEAHNGRIQVESQPGRGTTFTLLFPSTAAEAEPVAGPGKTVDQTELVQKIKAVNPDLPMIICTGYNEYLSGSQANELGFAAYLEKPVDREKLGRIVRQVLDDTR